jgi:anti-anti-sigma factor
VRQALLRGERQFLLDFSRVPSLDSAGVAEVVAVHHLVDQHWGQMVMFGTSPRIRRYFSITGLLPVLAVADTEAEGLQMLQRTNES